MADSHLPEDEATLYVLGELPAFRRAEFEARLAESVELRDLVRALEEGAVALSTASPQRRPPRQVWANVENALRRDSRQKWVRSAFGMGWWRNGWAVAVASIVGWVFYAVFVNVHHASPTAVPRETTVVATAPTTENVASKPPLPASSNMNVPLPRIRTDEISELRVKIAQLEKETGQLSQLIVQQRALLSESNRIKFYQLSPVANAGNDAAAPQLSPVLQRAVFLSIGRQLGWLPAEAKPRVATGDGHVTVNTVDGVDFVDLHPAKNDVANQLPNQPTSVQPKTESQPVEFAEQTIPAFVSGDNLVVALDPSVVPANSSLTFTTFGVEGGSFTMGANPTVVTIPFSSGSGGGGFLTVGTTSYLGQSNTIQFLVPANP